MIFAVSNFFGTLLNCSSWSNKCDFWLLTVVWIKWKLTFGKKHGILTIVKHSEAKNLSEYLTIKMTISFSCFLLSYIFLSKKNISLFTMCPLGVGAIFLANDLTFGAYLAQKLECVKCERCRTHPIDFAKRTQELTNLKWFKNSWKGEKATV